MGSDSGGLAPDHTVAPTSSSRPCAGHGIPLNATLVEMLGEHFSHRTERRGCGYTQATRHLAVLVNQRPEDRDTLAKLLPTRAGEGSKADLHRTICALLSSLEREESRLLAEIIADLVAPRASGAGELAARARSRRTTFSRSPIGLCDGADASTSWCRMQAIR